MIEIMLKRLEQARYTKDLNYVKYLEETIDKLVKLLAAKELRDRSPSLKLWFYYNNIVNKTRRGIV